MKEVQGHNIFNISAVLCHCNQKRIYINSLGIKDTAGVLTCGHHRNHSTIYILEIKKSALSSDYADDYNDLIRPLSVSCPCLSCRCLSPQSFIRTMTHGLLSLILDYFINTPSMSYSTNCERTQIQLRLGQV